MTLDPLFRQHKYTYEILEMLTCLIIAKTKDYRVYKIDTMIYLNLIKSLRDQ